MPRSLAFGAALLTGLTLAACGTSNTAATLPAESSPSAPVTVTATVTRSAGTDPGAATSVTARATATGTAAVTTQTITNPDSGGAGFASTAATTAAVGTRLCTAADLHVQAVPPNSAPGLTAVGITLTNVSDRPCRTGGWPGTAFVDTRGNVLATTPARTTGDELGTAPNGPLDLAPGATASYRVTVKRSATPGGDCAVSAVQVIPPDDTATLRTSIPDGPLELCGDASVVPLQPGSRGTGQ